MATLTIYPNAAGSITQFTPSSGNNWDCVNDTSESDYVHAYLTSDGEIRYDFYNLASVSAIPDDSTINKVTIYVKAKDDYNRDTALRIYVISVSYYGGGHSLTTTSTLFNDYWTTNPSTGLAWTKAQLETLQLGIAVINNSIGFTSHPTVYYAYVVIDYTLSSGRRRTAILDF